MMKRLDSENGCDFADLLDHGMYVSFVSDCDPVHVV